MNACFTTGLMRQFHRLLGVLVLSLFSYQTVAAETPVVVSVDHRVIANFSKPQLDGIKGVYTTEVRIKNRSAAPLLSPLRLTIEQFEGKDVKPLNAKSDGKDGQPYFEFALPKGMLVAGSVTEPLKVIFVVEKNRDIGAAKERVSNRQQPPFTYHVSASVDMAPLAPRSEPYALTADSGKVKVRFSVSLVGKVKSSATVYLRRIGEGKGVAMNDQGKDGDLVANDYVYGVSILVDASRMKPDTCLSYEAITNIGRSEVVSPQFNLCLSAFPVRVAASSKDKPVAFADGVKAVADEILITTVPNTKSDAIRNLAAEINAKVVGSIPSLSLYQLRLTAPVSANQLTDMVMRLNAKAVVKVASVNAIGSLASTPNDTDFSQQHGLQRVRAQDVWDMGALATGSGVTVTVLDSGLDRTHPDFGTSGNCQLALDASSGVANTDCGGTNNESIAPAGHGTQVAGVISAQANNNQGVAGVAYGSKLYSIKITPDMAVSDTEMISGFDQAAAYVASHGEASVINASFSTLNAAYNWTAVCNAINSAVLNGVTPRAVVVNAAGNLGSNNNFYPGRCNDVNPALTADGRKLFITVANSISSTTPIDPMCANAANLDQRCGGTTIGVNNTSNYGSWVDIAAPGMLIRTTAAGGGYVNSTGTSLSAPVVAGAAAILRACGVALDQIKSTLKTSGSNVHVAYPPGGAADWWPRLDIYRALSLVNHNPTGVMLLPNSLNENISTGAGYEVGKLTATDADTCDKYTYAINGGPDSARFSIGGAQNDRLMLSDGTLDYEAKPSYSVNILVTDFFGLTSSQLVTVNVVNLNDSTPVITSNGGGASASISVPENTTAVTTVTATDADNLGPLTYSISGTDASRFTINSSTGILTFSVPPDFEAPTDAGPDNVYNVVVQASDGTHTDTQAIAVTVTNANDSTPVITSNGGGASASISVPENTIAVTTVTATDADNLGALSYSISGTDASRFTINSSTGVLTFSAPPDFEVPTDAGPDNVYDVVVQASDGTHTDTQAIAVTVTNANDITPVITSNGGGASASITVPENTIAAVTTVTATDADNLGALGYTLSGTDASAFSINGSGVLTFNSAPDFETPADVGGDNIYNFNVQVSDGIHTDSQAITVTVANASEAPTGVPIVDPDPATIANRKVHQVLTANPSPVYNPDGWAISGYQWRRSGTDISGETASTHELNNDDVGSYMSVCVIYTDGGMPAVNATLCSNPDTIVVGDPHITTVDGLHFDFQGAGEFVALRGANGMEIQLRMAAVPTAPPFADTYTGLTSGVSVNTAVAARVGKHRVTYQPDTSPNAVVGTFVLRVDGVPTTLPADGYDLGDGGRVISQPSGIQIDFPDQTTLLVNTSSWPFYGAYWLHISVFHTSATKGIMGARSKGSWLPKLANGSALGAMPASLHDRYVGQYEKFANSWRVNKETTLFDYDKGTSTETFTDKAWPTENGPYAPANVPVAKPLGLKAAQLACRDIVGKNEKADCVFDVRVMGHADLAKGHVLNQKVRAGLTGIFVRDDRDYSGNKEIVTFTATVARHAAIARMALAGKDEKFVPTGVVQFTLNGKKIGEPVKLDARGQAQLRLPRPKIEKQTIGARYIPNKGSVFLPSSSFESARVVVEGKG